MARASLLAVFALSAIAASIPSHAVVKQRVDVQGATGMCKSTTVAYAAGVRYRPLGLANESAANIYVTCNWQGDDSSASGRGATRVYVALSNNSTASRNITCTLIEGHQDGGLVFASYNPKTVTIAAGAGATLAWVPGDVEGSPATIELPSLSCIMPPNSTIQYTGREYNEDVGA